MKNPGPLACNRSAKGRSRRGNLHAEPSFHAGFAPLPLKALTCRVPKARNFQPGAEPGELFEELRALIEQARQATARTLSSALTVLYWQVGHRIRRDVLYTAPQNLALPHFAWKLENRALVALRGRSIPRGVSVFDASTRSRPGVRPRKVRENQTMGSTSHSLRHGVLIDALGSNGDVTMSVGGNLPGALPRLTILVVSISHPSAYGGPGGPPSISLSVAPRNARGTSTCS